MRRLVIYDPFNCREMIRVQGGPVGLEQALAKAQTTLRSGDLHSEAHVRQAVIGPILQALDWDATDPSQWIPELPVPNGRVDDALLGHAGTPLVFVEAKKQGNLSPKAEEQLFDYAAKQGVPILVLTDGDTWDLYLSMAAGAPHERRFAHLELTPSGYMAPIAEDFARFLQREAVLSQQANFDAQQRLAEVNNRLKGKRGITAAWISLLRERDELLRELLIDRVEDQTGSRPWTEDVDDFLAERADNRVSGVPVSEQQDDVVVWLRTAPADLTPGMKSTITKWRNQLGDSEPKQAPKAARSRAPQKLSGNLHGIRIRGKEHEATVYKRVHLLLASELQNWNSDLLGELAALVKPGMKSPRAVRASDPILRSERSKYYQQVPSYPEWYLHVWLSAKDHRRHMREMAELAGLQWGRDVELLIRD